MFTHTNEKNGTLNYHTITTIIISGGRTLGAGGGGGGGARGGGLRVLPGGSARWAGAGDARDGIGRPGRHVRQRPAQQPRTGHLRRLPRHVDGWKTQMLYFLYIELKKWRLKISKSSKHRRFQTHVNYTTIEVWRWRRRRKKEIIRSITCNLSRISSPGPRALH